MTIKYPTSFDLNLGRNPRVRSAIDSSIGVVAEIIQISTLPFFPDYTGHGMDHLSSVLEIIDKLIADQSRSEFTAEDAAVLTFSVLLHDLALHLSESGFLTLLSTSHALGQAKGYDWAATFEDFISEAKHWDERKLSDVVGVDEFGAPRSLARNPMNHYSALTESDRKLIGEFIRRHHATLAYEFATIGFPGSKGQRIEFTAFSKDLREVAGHVARSHGLTLRMAITHLNEAQISPLEFVGVHPVYLMGLLRVADFLELGPDRAPLIAFQYKDITSPVSQKEWRTNQAFRRISWGNPEPESIQIPAKPSDLQSFLELKKWLTGIQDELDTTWAVYGEIYGAHPRFSRFQLTVRRVHSNILDAPETFARNSSFVPKRISLSVGGPEILKLFIEPLYGLCPEFGIRELLQNSVDAVRERRMFEERMMLRPHQPDQNADVVIWLDDPDTQGNSSLTITDQGIGMTEEIVAEYFMRAGASFRRSIAWKKHFAAERQDHQTSTIRASVLRSGRFGIGVLAAFLLGDQIEVWTRHITSARGIRFSVPMVLEERQSESDSIQLDYDDSIPIGTTITIKVTKVRADRRRFNNANIFSEEQLWDWYCLKEPSVRRYNGGSREELAQHVTVPPENGPLPEDWHAVPSSDYRTVHVYTGGKWSPFPALVCNGIMVASTSSNFDIGSLDYASSGRWQSELFPGQGVFRLTPPSLSIFDPDGTLPLNLQRTGLINIDLDFLPNAFLVQTKAALASILISAPTSPTISERLHKALTKYLEFDQLIPVFFTTEGTALLTERNLQMARARQCLLVEREIFQQGWLSDAYRHYDAVLVCTSGSHRTSAIYSMNDLSPWIERVRVITTSDEEPIVARPLRFRYREGNYGNVYIRRGRDCPPTLLEPSVLESINKQISLSLRHRDTFVAAELFLKTFDTSTTASSYAMGNIWQKVIGETEIPFDSEIRHAALKNVYEDLSEFIPAPA